ncbi:MAG: TIGR03619 family F420-dependent LLM class oxidoreductase [Chloroflexi bacterium]|nr:TIGR03619 family F420-dependent LLM class oxidoreductase [Chloroflexota bacterium]
MPPARFLKVGVYLPNFSYDDESSDHRARLRYWITQAEAYGFDSLWVTDHLLRARQMYARSWLEPLTSLAFAAALTERVLLGPAVLLLPLRQPVLLAKELATLQRLSHNRLILGVGTGWYPPEFAAVGQRRAERGRRTDEVLALVRRLLAGERVTVCRQDICLRDEQLDPSPVPLPVWVGGGSQVPHPDSVERPLLHPRVARRIARADGWLTRPTALPQQIVQDWQQLQPYLAAAGRHPDEIIIAHGQWLHLTEEDRHDRAVAVQLAVAADIVGTARPPELLQASYLFGTLDEIVAACQERAAVGVEHLILHPYTDDPAQLDLWGRLLLPRLKALPVTRPPVVTSEGCARTEEA